MLIDALQAFIDAVCANILAVWAYIADILVLLLLVYEFILELKALNDAVVANVPFNVFWDAV